MTTPDRFVHGCAVGIGVVEEEPGTIDIDLLWIDQLCPETISIPGMGTYKIPSKAVNQPNTFTIHGIRLLKI
jgi:hypothetical protein